MQSQQNAQNYSNESSSVNATSPLNKVSQDFKQFSFKSPISSGQKKRFSKSKINNENVEPEQNNPFSAYNRDKASPSPFTPNKVKEEFSLGDFTGGSKDLNMLGRPYESPFTTFCKDLSLSPNAYNFPSPGTLLMRLQFHNQGYLPNSTYSPIFDNKMGSPMFPKKNITRLDFNSSKYIMLQSHKDEVNIEADDQIELLELHKGLDATRYDPHPCGEDTTTMQANQLKLPTKKSIYTSSMVPSQTKTHEVFSQRTTQESEPYRGHRFVAPTSLNAETEHINQSSPVNMSQNCPRTPSPATHYNKKIQLDSMNSFSGQAKRLNSAIDEKEKVHSGYEENSESSLLKRKYTLGTEDEMVEEFHSSKSKKKVCCNCKKSRCLKLYCDCFGRGIACSKECNCVNCYNTEAHVKERQEAVVSILERNPSAFKPKIDRTDSPEKVTQVDYTDQGRVRHMKGCNCKKSGCLKRYCECYQAGVKCTELCKCENCKNMDSCCRFKRAQNYGLINFGSQDNLSMNAAYSSSKSIKQENKQYYQNEEAYESHEDDENTIPYHSTRARLISSYPDPRAYSDLPVSKKRKLDVSVSEFTPKRTLVFQREENIGDELDTNTYGIQTQTTEKRKGAVNFRMPYSQTEKKNLNDDTMSPGKHVLSGGRRTKRNIRPFNHFDPEEYDVRK